MSISGQPAVSLVDSILNAQTDRVDMSVEVLKKVQESMRQQGEAAIKMLEQAGIQPDTRRLDTYA